MMDWLCCYEFSIAFGSDTDLQDYGRTSQNRKKKSNRSRMDRVGSRPGRNSRVDSYTSSIAEDALLEDMCQLADMEFDGDATSMTDRAKNKMLKRLSRAPQTENLFKSERALSEFVQRQQLGLPGQKGPSRHTHLGVYSLGIDSRMSMGSRMSGLANSGMQGSASRMSRNSYAVGAAPSRMSNMSRMSYTKNNIATKNSQQKLFGNPNPSNHNTQSNHNMQSNHNLQKQPAKRASKTYEMATQIINKGGPQRESIGNPIGGISPGGRLSSTLKNMLNPNNSIVNERNMQKFGQQNQATAESQHINNLDDLRRARKSQKPKRISSKI